MQGKSDAPLYLDAALLAVSLKDPAGYGPVRQYFLSGAIPEKGRVQVTHSELQRLVTSMYNSRGFSRLSSGAGIGTSTEAGTEGSGAIRGCSLVSGMPVLQT